MPKKPNIPPKKKLPLKKSNKGKLTAPGKKRTPRCKPNVIVRLPAVIPGKGAYTVEEESEYEISYKDAMLAVQMEALAAKGLSNDEIIDLLPISRFTFYRRLKEDAYFSYCLKKHRGEAVLNVESSLYKAANGFKYKEQTATPTGKVVTVKKQKTPDVAAIKFFLTNRDRSWTNKPEPTLQAAESMQSIQFSIKRREE